MNDNTPMPTRRIQFSVRDLFLLVFLVSAFLGLVIELKHVGFAASCCLAGVVVGWRFGNRRLLVAASTAALVFVVTYLACWIRMGRGADTEPWQRVYIRHDLHRIRQAISEYAKSAGKLPDSLQELTQQTNELPYSPSGQLLDSWDQPWHYRKTADGFELASLGRDGRVGGLGLDADLFLGREWDSVGVHLPMPQFLIAETPVSGAVFMAAVFASLSAGSIWYTAQRDRQLPPRWLAVGVLVTIVSAVCVAVYLAGVYLLASDSGH